MPLNFMFQPREKLSDIAKRERAAKRKPRESKRIILTPEERKERKKQRDAIYKRNNRAAHNAHNRNWYARNSDTVRAKERERYYKNKVVKVTVPVALLIALVRGNSTAKV